MATSKLRNLDFGIKLTSKILKNSNSFAKLTLANTRVLSTSSYLEKASTTMTSDSSGSTTGLGHKKTFGNPLVTPYLSPSVWTDIVGLTIKHKACNLGQGFPDYPPPAAAKEALLKATENDFLHQYTRGYGHPRLVNAIAALYGKDMER